ncbi:lipase maturation factor family protein [Thiogranum longum]
MEKSTIDNGYVLVSGLFLRLLALIYFAAFVSTGWQIIGLAGEQGILPVAEKIEQLRSLHGWAGFWSFPTLFWLDASNDALFAVSLAGCVFALLLFLDVAPRFSLVMLFILYLSLFHAGQLFMNFQWDYMLLESGFIAIFLGGGRRPAVWLMRWLLFRVRFLSGVSKLLSQDPTWANLTALNYFFEVQPLPHWGGWYAHQLPDWLLRFGTGSALFIEIVVPFMILMPRRIRLVGAWLTILMQVLILLTSNHNYANFLVLALCLFLFDDRDVARVIPKSLAGRLSSRTAGGHSATGFSRASMAAIASAIVIASLLQAWSMVSGRRAPDPVAAALDHLRPFRIVNNYHVFPTMKTERIELVIEGSMDGLDWRVYEFKYKPGDVRRRPEVVVPHHPRLDWLMWFVPMHPAFLPFFDNFMQRLAEASPSVLDLLQTDPFPGQAPRYLRVSVYRYRFTSPDTRAVTGEWWQREYLGPFFPLPGMEGKK